MAKNFVKLQPYELTQSQIDDVYDAIRSTEGLISAEIPRECVKAFYIPGPSVSDLNFNNTDDSIPRGTIEICHKSKEEVLLGTMYALPLFLKEHINSLFSMLDPIGIFTGITPKVYNYRSSGPFIGIVLAGYDNGSDTWDESAAEAFNSAELFYKYESPDGLCP